MLLLRRERNYKLSLEWWILKPRLFFKNRVVDRPNQFVCAGWPLFLMERSIQMTRGPVISFVVEGADLYRGSLQRTLRCDAR